MATDALGVLLFILAAGASAAPAPAKTEKPPAKSEAASANTVEMVEAFLKMETSALPAESIPDFLRIDADSLPERLQDRYRVKKMELEALRISMESKRKPPIRRMGMAPATDCDPEKGSKAVVKYLVQSGFEKLTPDEVKFVGDRTRCSECELVEEFGLKMVLIPAVKKKKPEIEYLMHASSPAMTLVAQFRGGGKGGTNFFSIGFAGACHQE